MPITELVFPRFKPGTAQEAAQALRAGAKMWNETPGVLFHRLGQLKRLNGADIAPEHRSVLAIDWDNEDSFHAAVPNSAPFKAFIGTVSPFAAEKPIPLLFRPAKRGLPSEPILKSGAVQIFIGDVGEKQQEVESAWDRLGEVLEKETSDVTAWSGNGFEQAERTWLGMLGWKNVEILPAIGGRDSRLTNGQDIEEMAGKKSIVEAVQALKAFEGIEDFVANFDS